VIDLFRGMQMAQLAAIKAMFHNDAKVLERLDRIETCHESTNLVVTAIFKYLKSVEKPIFDDHLAESSKDSKGVEDSWDTKKDQNICYAENDVQPDCAAVFTSGSSAHQTSAVQILQKDESLRQSVGGTDYNSIICELVEMEVSAQGSGSILKSENEHNGQVLVSMGAIDLGGADLELTQLENSISNGEKMESIPLSRNSRPVPNDAYFQKASSPLQNGLCKMMADPTTHDASEDSAGDKPGQQLKAGMTSRHYIPEFLHSGNLSTPLASMASASHLEKKSPSVPTHREDGRHLLPATQGKSKPHVDKDSGDSGVIARLVH
jgi:hypothetical protein